MKCSPNRVAIRSASVDFPELVEPTMTMRWQGSVDIIVFIYDSHRVHYRCLLDNRLTLLQVFRGVLRDLCAVKSYLT